jgi:hypothetical protein
MSTDCTNPKGHSYYVNGHVARCQNSGCNKIQTYNPQTRTWEDAKK